LSVAVESIRTELASIVGESRAVSDPVICASAAVNGMAPGSVIYPSSAEQVAEVLRYAADHDLAVIPFRNGTKLDIGNPPRRYDLALSLKDLNQVWHYEPGDLTVSVEPGMKLGDFQHFLARHRLWLPLDPTGGPRASLGGILAANSSGPLRLRYGAPRDMVLGMKIATTEGKLIKTGGRVVKNVAGYDLAKLLIGSYGTLGVIVETSFKLFPVPAECSTFILSVPTLEVARKFRHRLLDSPLTPMRMLLLDAAAAALTRGTLQPEPAGQGFEIWVEAGGTARVLERCGRELEHLAQSSGAAAEPMDAGQAKENWARAADFRTWLPEVVPDPVIVRAHMPIAAGEMFVERAIEEAKRSKIHLACFCQTGAGVISLCLIEVARPRRDGAPDAPIDPPFVNRLRDAAQGLGGVLVVERCPAGLKSRLDVWGPVGDDVEVMQKVKAAWDPKGVLAPGRFVGGV
jgi:glycolate oxidase FAD binding subunit